MSKGLNFDSLEPIEVPTSIKGKEYVLREASGGVGCQYRNALLKCTRLGPGGKPATVHGLADVEPMLVSWCLFKIVKDEATGDKTGEKPVSVATVRAWPARVQKALFERAKEISELSEEETERELLVKALALPGSPVSVADLEVWINSLGEEYSALQSWFEPSPEEKAKKEPSSTEDGLN